MVRPGSIIGSQQQYLQNNQSRMWALKRAAAQGRSPSQAWQKSRKIDACRPEVGPVLKILGLSVKRTGQGFVSGESPSILSPKPETLCSGKCVPRDAAN